MPPCQAEALDGTDGAGSLRRTAKWRVKASQEPKASAELIQGTVRRKVAKRQYAARKEVRGAVTWLLLSLSPFHVTLLLYTPLHLCLTSARASTAHRPS